MERGEGVTRFNTTVIQFLFSSLQKTAWVKISGNNTLALFSLTALTCRGTSILDGRTRKLSQRTSNIFVIYPPLRVGPLTWGSGRTSLGVIKLAQPPHQLLVRPHCKDKIDSIWRIKITRLKSERSGSKTPGHPTWATRMKYSSDSSRP